MVGRSNLKKRDPSPPVAACFKPYQGGRRGGYPRPHCHLVAVQGRQLHQAYTSEVGSRRVPLAFPGRVEIQVIIVEDVQGAIPHRIS